MFVSPCFPPFVGAKSEVFPDCPLGKYCSLSVAVTVGAIVTIIDPEMITISKKCRSSIKIWIRSGSEQNESFHDS